MEKVYEFIKNQWHEEITPALKEYIQIPNKSPLFDSKWKENGYMDKAMDLMESWCRKHPLKGMVLERLELPGRTPVLFAEIPAFEQSKSDEKTILFYGHMDKQPEMEGWEEGLGPWKAVQRGEKLYGRGGADDGYAIFASWTAIEALQKAGLPHCRCVILIEGSEESGSMDLPYYIDHLQGRLGQPDLVICLDSGCGNYEQLWCTSSLRGIVGASVEINVLKDGIHSGQGSGVVPNPFSVLRILLDRIEDAATGEVKLDSVQNEIPQKRVQQAQKASEVLKDDFFDAYSFVGKSGPYTQDISDLILRKTWKSALSVVGFEGLPNIAQAGNVTIPCLKAKLSLRIPPTGNVKVIEAEFVEKLSKNAPFDTLVKVELEDSGPGWHAPILSDQLEDIFKKASKLIFNKELCYIGEGGSIPFMGMLGEKFPKAEFFITGVLGPKSNAHGPNEFIHLTYAENLTKVAAYVLAEYS